MIYFKQGNLLTEPVEALVNPVNCVGVMGRGLALEFKRAFSGNFKLYAEACLKGQVKPGKMFIVPTQCIFNPHYIINFPTKTHWKLKSQLNYIETGLKDLVEQVKILEIKSIAIPPLGCGNGGLEWAEVLPLIESAFAEVDAVDVVIYTPPEIPQLVKSLITESACIGFSGSRSAISSSLNVLTEVTKLIPDTTTIVVGCAQGIDKAVRNIFSDAVVFYVSDFGQGRGAFAARSIACVQRVRHSRGIWISFPVDPCPPGLLPSINSSECFCGKGSGTWASLALAVGLNIPSLVWCPPGVEVPQEWNLKSVGEGWYQSCYKS